MALFNPEVRRRTDALDAAGNTTAAIGKAATPRRGSDPAVVEPAAWEASRDDTYGGMDELHQYTSIYINTMVVINGYKGYTSILWWWTYGYQW